MSLPLHVFYLLTVSPQSNQNNEALSGLKDILGKLKALSGGDSDSQMNQAEEMKRKSEAYHFDPNQVLPPEAVKQLKEVLKFHDDVLRDIIKKMEMIPGLTDLVDGLSTALNACEPPFPGSVVRSLTPPSKTCTRLSRHTSQYVLLTVPSGRDAHRQRLAGPHAGHLCCWRGFRGCHLLR